MYIYIYIYITKCSTPITLTVREVKTKKNAALFQEYYLKPCNYHTNQSNMEENPLLYVRLSLQVDYCSKC